MKRTVTPLLLVLAVPAALAQSDPEIARIVAEVSPQRIGKIVETLVSFETRHSLSDPKDPKRGVGAARNWIKSEFETYVADSGGRLQVEFDSFLQPAGGRIDQPAELVNVVATLPGTDPGAGTRMFVVGGHYDSMPRNVMDRTSTAHGANDDASGTAVVLEAARVLSKRKFPWTVVFIAFIAEEQGLLGARHWADMAKQKNWHVTMLNNDIVGGNRGTPKNDWVRVFSEGVPIAETPEEARTRQSVGGEVDSPSRQLARTIEEVQRQYVPGFPARMVWRRDRFGRGGDHTPFNEKGYAAVRFCEAYEDFNRQHQNVREENGQRLGDLVEFVDFEYIANVARVNAATLAVLASAPAPPRNVTYVTERGENSTLLAWEAPEGEAPAGYEVVWRETAAPRWESSKVTGNVTRQKFAELSKDNYFFGVRSVGPKGHRSMVVFPRPPARAPGPADARPRVQAADPARNN